MAVASRRRCSTRASARWLLFLPVVAGLWIWGSGWATAVRLLLVAGIGIFNLYLFFPGYLLKR